MTLKTGRPCSEKTVGMPVFEYFAKTPEYSEVFNRAMTIMSAAVIPAALEAYDFSGVGVLVDVAGGHGEVLMSILRANPRMRGILMDLDHVIAGQDHLFQHAAGARVAGRHFFRLRSASTSGAGVRSPVQLMRRGAFTNLSVNLSER